VAAGDSPARAQRGGLLAVEALRQGLLEASAGVSGKGPPRLALACSCAAEAGADGGLAGLAMPPNSVLWRWGLI
jgi:hypothetical protein